MWIYFGQPDTFPAILKLLNILPKPVRTVHTTYELARPTKESNCIGWIFSCALLAYVYIRTQWSNCFDGFKCEKVPPFRRYSRGFVFVFAFACLSPSPSVCTAIFFVEMYFCIMLFCHTAFCDLCSLCYVNIIKGGFWNSTLQIIKLTHCFFLC